MTAVPKSQIPSTQLWSSFKNIHGCLGYVGCRRDCRIGALSIKTSFFVQKREYLNIRLIVCIWSARFGDPTTSLEFLHWHFIYHKQPAKKISFSLLSSCMRITISYFPFLDRGTASRHCLSTIIGTHGPKGFHIYRNTNSIELWNLARGIRVIYSLLFRLRSAIDIPCFIWMILPSLCHSFLVYQLMNCWMCLKLLVFFNSQEERVAIHEIQVHKFYQLEQSRRVSGA